MSLRQLITPRNDDGSIAHRYIPIAKAITELAGEGVETQLQKLYVATTNLEKESAPAGLQLCIALFSVPMDERYERSKFKKHIRQRLQEIGFKPSKASKLMGAGCFYAEHKNHTFNSDFDSESTEAEFNDNRDRFLDEYFKSISKLYELSRMNGKGVSKIHRDFLNENKVYSQSELEELVRCYPKDEYKWRDRKPDRANFQEAHPKYALATHESLVVMDDAVEKSVIKQPESGQKLIKQFFQLFLSGEIEHRLAEFTPNAQAHLIDEIKEGIHLLEEFVAKYKIIEVTHIH
ncbi:hypothetical protein OAE36_02105 [bacterium]|jgi:hypothetical protein|nr:hypothetical protein [bacterium]